MKALILAGGRGKRLGNASEEVNKCMIEVNNKPLLEYSLDCVARLEKIEEIVVVVGYRSEDIIQRYKNDYAGKRIIYVYQHEQRGLVNAIECAKGAIGTSDFMLMLGDEFMANPHHQEFIDAFYSRDVFGLCGVVSVKDKELIKKTYTVIHLEDGRVVRLIEKPNNPNFNNIMGTGNCVFKSELFEYIPRTPINQNRQEKELPDLIQCAVDDGQMIRSFIICDEYVNVNSPDELQKTSSYFAHL